MGLPFSSENMVVPDRIFVFFQFPLYGIAGFFVIYREWKEPKENFFQFPLYGIAGFFSAQQYMDKYHAIIFQFPLYGIAGFFQYIGMSSLITY